MAPGEFFKWQATYGAFTVSPEAIEAISTYIRSQKTHHAARSLIEEWEKCDIENTES